MREDSQRCVYTNFGTWKEKKKKTRTANLEKHELDACPMIVVRKSVPRIRTVKSKEKIKDTTSDSKCLTTTCETPNNVMRLCVNLMPVLAAAKESVEEERGKEEDSSCTSKKRPETSSKDDPSATQSVEQTLEPSDSHTGFRLDADTKPPVNPQFELPPVTEFRTVLDVCDDRRTKRSLAPLPPIGSSEQSRTISSNFTVRACGGDGLLTGQAPDSRPWIDNPLFSRSRAAEFRLPDISLSSLDALLQTVTRKLRRKRRGGDEEPWRCVQSDHLLMAVSEQRREEKSVRQQIVGGLSMRNLTHIDAATGTSASGRHANRERSLPPLLSALKPTLVLTMTKTNLLTSNTLQ